MTLLLHPKANEPEIGPTPAMSENSGPVAPQSDGAVAPPLPAAPATGTSPSLEERDVSAVPINRGCFGATTCHDASRVGPRVGMYANAFGICFFAELRSTF